MFEEELAPTLYNPIQKSEVEGALPNSFYDNSIIITLEPDKKECQKKKKNCRHHLSWIQIQKPLPKLYQIESTW